MNIEVTLLYRDGCNYKTSANHIFETNLSMDEAARIGQRLRGLDEIVPEDLGLENPRDQFPQKGYDIGEDDHCFCEITDVCETEENGHEKRLFEEFAADILDRMEHGNWTIFDPESGYNGRGMRKLSQERVKEIIDDVLAENPTAEARL